MCWASEINQECGLYSVVLPGESREIGADRLSVPGANMAVVPWLPTP